MLPERNDQTVWNCAEKEATMFQPFRLERYFAKYEFTARHLLCTSDCESLTIEELLDLDPMHAAHDRQALLETWLGYTESRGAPALREAIAHTYHGIGAGDVLVHAGAEEAILNLYLALLRSGDAIIVQYPCYQSLEEIPVGLGADVIRWQVRQSSTRGWYFDPADLEEALKLASARHGGKPPAMVVLNQPHNPTGTLMSRQDFDTVIRLCAERDIVLLTDEVYRGLEYDDAQRLPAVCEAYPHGISLGVLSKAWGLAGLRIGWLATRRHDILDAVAVVKDHNSICASAPSETMARVALARSERILARNRQICTANRDAFAAFFSRWSTLFSWHPPQGGSIAFPHLTESGVRRWGSAARLAERLVEETGVLLLPGSMYGDDFAAHFRIGLGRKMVMQGLSIFEDWLTRQHQI